MTEVLLERTFDPPIGPEDVYGMAQDAAGCFQIHRVGWRGSYLSGDGRRMLCWFHGLDAESVRIALRESGAAIGSLWPGTVHDAPAAAVPAEAANVVVERSWQAPVTLEEIQAIEDAEAWCLETHRVHFVRTFFSRDRRRMICLYEAPDAESVRLAQRQAGMPVDRVWAFRRVPPVT